MLVAAESPGIALPADGERGHRSGEGNGDSHGKLWEPIQAGFKYSPHTPLARMSYPAPPWCEMTGNCVPRRKMK